MQIYESENEFRFKITKTEYARALVTCAADSKLPILRSYKALNIEQIWLDKQMLSNGTRKSSRIRRTEEINHTYLWETKYEYTTKYYYKDTSQRIELNTPIGREEYQKIKQLYNNAGEDTLTEYKTRIYLEDTETGLHYTVDIPEKTDDIKEGKDNVEFVFIEIEFTSPEEKQKYKIPKWLTDAVNKAN